MDDEMKNFANNYYSVTSVNDFDNPRDVEVLKYKYFILGCELIYNKLRESQNLETSDEALHIADVVGQSGQLKCGFCQSNQNVEEIPVCDKCWDGINNH